MIKFLNPIRFRTRAVVGAWVITAAIAGASPASASSNCLQGNAPPFSLTHNMSAIDQATLHDQVVACQQAKGPVVTMQSIHTDGGDGELPAEYELNRKMR